MLEKTNEIDVVFLRCMLSNNSKQKISKEAPVRFANEYLESKKGIDFVYYLSYYDSAILTQDSANTHLKELTEKINEFLSFKVGISQKLIFSISLEISDSTILKSQKPDFDLQLICNRFQPLINCLKTNYPNSEILFQNPFYANNHQLKKLKYFNLEIGKIISNPSEYKANTSLSDQSVYQFFIKNLRYKTELRNDSLLGTLWGRSIYKGLVNEEFKEINRKIGIGAEFSIFSLKLNTRFWFSNSFGVDLFCGVASELDDINPNDFEAGFKLLHALSYKRTQRTYIGVVGKYRWLNLTNENARASLPIPGVIIGKEWYSKRIKRKGFAVELGYQFGSKEYEILSPDNHNFISKEKFEEFPLILNLRYSFYTKRK